MHSQKEDTKSERFRFIRRKRAPDEPKYPDLSERHGIPWTGIENASAEMKALGKPQMDLTKLPFDPFEYTMELDELPLDRNHDPGLGGFASRAVPNLIPRRPNNRANANGDSLLTLFSAHIVLHAFVD